MDQHTNARARRARRFRPGYLFLCCLALVGLMGALMFRQEKKLQEIAQEQAVLQAQLDEQLIEEQRLEQMQEYVQTDEYLEQYAREKFGYVQPGDYKFYREEDENA